MNREFLKKLNFIYEKDILENGHHIKEPWIVNQLTAFLDGQEVGYLKISYIPKKKCQEYWSDIWDFIGTECGVCGLDKCKTTEERYKYLFDRYYCQKDLVTNKEKLKEINIWASKYQKRFDDLTSYLVDKPYVDFIRVHESYQRNGVAVALYVRGAKELAKEKFVLHASTIQSDEVKACWEWMEFHDIPVKRENGRKFLDYR